MPCAFSASSLQQMGLSISLSYPLPQSVGFDLKFFEQALSENTALVSVMQVNNETGVMLPTKAIAEHVQVYRGNGIWPRMHVDAAQALAYVEELATDYADLITYSGYKVGAVPGSAALVVKDRDHLMPLIRRRPGAGTAKWY